MQRRLVLALPGVAIATGAGLWAQAHKTATAPLPHLDDLDPSGRYGDPKGPSVTIDVLGDSTVTAPGLARGSRSWIARLVDPMPWDIALRSHARGGSRVHNVLREQVPAAIENAPDLFVLAVGPNDAMHATPGPFFRRDLGRLLDELSELAPVVTLGIGDLSVIPRLPRSLRPMVARRSALIDRLHEKVTADRPRVVRVPARGLSSQIFEESDGDLFVADQFHPNDVVHGMWASMFAPYVRSQLDALALR